MKIIRHITATTIIVHKNKTLLHLHKKLNKWLPAGGHIKENELPEVAALREAREEAGLEIELYSPDKSVDFEDAKQLVRPAHIILEDISESHQHIDMIYFARTNSEALRPQNGESNNIRWFTKKEIEELDNVPINTVKLCLEALKVFSKM